MDKQGAVITIADRIDPALLKRCPNLNPEFLKLKNVVLTPHIASSSQVTRHQMAMLAAENLVAALTGVTPPNLLNPLT